LNELSPSKFQTAESSATALLVDNPTLILKVRKVLFCGDDEARRAVVEVIKFLSLAAGYRGGSLTPSHRVDLAWHEFILCTRAYEQFCQQTFGKFIHHQPDGTNKFNQQRFNETLRLYRQRFGAPPDEFWIGEKSAGTFCGNCESPGE